MINLLFNVNQPKIEKVAI